MFGGLVSCLVGCLDYSFKVIWWYWMNQIISQFSEIEWNLFDFQGCIFLSEAGNRNPLQKILHVDPQLTDRRWTSKLNWWKKYGNRFKVMVRRWEVLNVDTFLFTVKMVFAEILCIPFTFIETSLLQESKIAGNTLFPSYFNRVFYKWF